MPRPLWLRVLIALWGVWFNAALLEAPGIHTCAVHSGATMASHDHGSLTPAATSNAMTSMAEPMTHDHASHHAAAGSSALAASAASDQHSTPADNACACTCLGTCCGVAPVALASNRIDIAEHYATLAPRRIGERVVAPHVDRTYDRPFANGPPTLV